MVTKMQTEEVCGECGSTNIGYDAWVKNINGEMIVVGGPYDNSQCFNEHCGDNANCGAPAGQGWVRDVPIKDLRDCDGKDCYYNGDKGEMKEVKSTVLKESYWYCSNCIVDRWSESLERIEESN